MGKLYEITKLLGEENEKKLKDTVTDLIIEQIEDDLKNNGLYLIDFDELMDEIRDEIRDELKVKVRDKYMKMAEDKFADLFEGDGE